MPDCDVLELDCEGAELGILNNINVRPRVITVEIHNGEILKADDVINTIHNIGYVIQERTANGKVISESEFQNAVNIRREKTPSEKDWYKPPKIIATYKV